MSNATDHSPIRRQHWLSLVIFLVVVIGAGSLIGAATAPGEWYAGLAKPPFNPPNWVFAPVWTILYALIAVAGWRVWQRDRSGTAMKAWFAQMGLNWLWSPVFFSAQLPWPALVVILLMLAAIVTFVVTARKLDAVASWLMVPYLAWVSFAMLLNAAVAVLN